MFVNVLCTIKHFRMRKASRSVIILYCNAEAAGFEPANRLRAVNCFRGSLLQPLGHASCYYIGTLSQTIPIPPTPFSRGRSGPAGFPSPLCLPCPPAPARHLMMPCYFIGTLSQTLTLRAAFTSSTYLLSQIPGPGRSSDDDLLNSPDPLFKGAIRACGLSIAAVPSLPASSGPASDDALLFYWDSVPNPDTPCGLYVLHVFAVANTRTRPVV